MAELWMLSRITRAWESWHCSLGTSHKVWEKREIKILLASVFGRKQREEDFRGMGNAPLSQLSPVREKLVDFIVAGVPGRFPQGSARNLWQALL